MLKDKQHWILGGSDLISGNLIFSGKPQRKQPNLASSCGFCYINKGENMFIYMITNKITNKSYIGRTCKNIYKRLQEHFCDSKYIKNNCPLHKDMKIYKKTDFDIQIIFEFNTDNYFDADTIELKLIEKFNTFYPKGYNIRKVRRNGR